ncbi:MAG: hypothetical protein IPN95_13400 [Bacteroidetes bacterium]|jgi:hypothetical protein|nr:hypothetical protein [Bacteroidota bacterium]MBP6721504.1 hypothetical protein [Bacteroidia bacterium]
MKNDEWAESESNPTERNQEFANPISSRWMLGKVIVVVSGLLTLLQIVLFFVSRWTRMESENLMGDTVVRITLNPLLIWLPVWNGIIAGIWWWNCRKGAAKKEFIALVTCLMIALALVIVSISMHVPSSYTIQRPGERNLYNQFPRLDLQSY